MQNVLWGKSFAFFANCEVIVKLFTPANGAYILKLHSVSETPQNFSAVIQMYINKGNFSWNILHLR